MYLWGRGGPRVKEIFLKNIFYCFPNGRGLESGGGLLNATPDFADFLSNVTKIIYLPSLELHKGVVVL